MNWAVMNVGEGLKMMAEAAANLDGGGAGEDDAAAQLDEDCAGDGEGQEWWQKPGGDLRYRYHVIGAVSSDGLLVRSACGVWMVNRVWKRLKNPAGNKCQRCVRVIETSKKSDRK